MPEILATESASNGDDLDEIRSQLNNLNGDFNKNIKSISNIVDNLLTKFNNQPESFENNKGISFLSMKNMLMIEYLINLLNLVYLKSNGKKINSNPCILRLAELRCVIEKSKSIEVKLKYQIDKLLKLAVSSSTGEQNSLSFRANIDNFANSSQNNEDEEMDEEQAEHEEQKNDGIYRPPKLAPVYNDIDESREDKAKREIERLKRRAMSSAIMKEIENEYSGAPEEIKDSYANTLESESKDLKHRIEYEEENFVRKPLTKKEMQAMKRLKRGTNLNSLSSFDDARLLLDENINMEDFLKTKKEKSKKTKKGKKGAKKGLKKKKKIRYT